MLGTRREGGWIWQRGRPLLGILPASSAQLSSGSARAQLSSAPTRATNEIQSASTLPAISMSLKLSIFTYLESKLSHVFALSLSLSSCTLPELPWLLGTITQNLNAFYVD